MSISEQQSGIVAPNGDWRHSSLGPTDSNPDLTTWTWVHDPHLPQRRPTLCRHWQAQDICQITADEPMHLALNPNFTYADVLYRIHHNWSEPSQHQSPSRAPLQFDLTGFKNAHNSMLWHSLLHNFLLQWDPTIYVTCRIPSEAPQKGKTTITWIQSVKALTAERAILE
jgi:hypothetical protein